MKRFGILMLALLPVFCAVLQAESAGNSEPGLPAGRIVELLRTADEAKGQSDGLVWDVFVRDDEGIERRITVKSKNDNGLARFTAPPSVKGQMLLKRGYNMWFIKPGISKPISISPRQRLIGGLSNADIAATSFADDYNGSFVGKEDIDGELCYVLDLSAKNKKVTYNRVKYWVVISSGLAVKAEFYSVSNKLMKTARLEYKNRVNGQRPFISAMKVEDAQRDNAMTYITYSNIRTEKLNNREFALEQLQ